tara:strand:- start:85 stop:732 length:648 start_codon:yes stop_codon:yes gene_type:complete
LRENAALNVQLLELTQDFINSAKMYGRVIILERFLETGGGVQSPVHRPGQAPQKTITPVHMGGVAGGDKYIVNNIMFKFAVDSHDIYGDDRWAAKAAGLELLGYCAYFNTHIPGLSLPLVAVVDFMGYRLICESVLPITRRSLVYGSCDAGKTVHKKNKYFSRMMKEAGKALGLGSESPGLGEEKIWSATDAEGHIGRDHRFYLVKNPPYNYVVI